MYYYNKYGLLRLISFDNPKFFSYFYDKIFSEFKDEPVFEELVEIIPNINDKIKKGSKH